MTGPVRRPPFSRPPADNDEALWTYITQDIEPIRSKRRVASANKPLPNPKTEPALPTARLTVRPQPAHKPEATASLQQPATTGFDRRKVRKLAAGQIDIDARLDLHGMHQAEAHASLRRFLLTGHAQGWHHVLIITGKGGSALDFLPQGDRVGRGVLKHNVPRWLAEPDLRPFVIGYRAAHVRHGGEGALYVALRRARKEPR